ncbi:MAG: outer membrane protein OmpA-like peptidoglycan-associated protein [Saprospiraceae bacterium]
MKEAVVFQHIAPFLTPNLSKISEMNLYKMLIILLCCFSATALSAQKQLIKKANTYYKNNQYKDAIELYEQALKEDDNLGSSTKLAYCYRMTNQMVKAEEWYTKVVAREKAKSITYLYYAESLMSNGKYDLAKNWFLKYNEKEPDDKNAIRMAYACDKVKLLTPYFKNVAVEVFEHNSDVDESSPLYFNDGIVFTSDRSSGPNPLKQKSGWTGRDYQRIYFSAKKSDGNYDSPVNFSKKLNDLNKHCGPVSFTKDKKTVIFTRTGQDRGKNNAYNIQLFSAESDDGKKWKNIALLSFCNKEHNYMHPAISPDGSKLFFVSDKPGGLGGTDIYMSEKKAKGWGRPQNLGPIINTLANEAFPFFHESNKLFFCSKGHLSFGGFDILFSNIKEDGSWQKPVNVGKPINSSYDDISISLDESMESGLFSSSRNGGDDDIYIFKILEGVDEDLESIDFEGIVEKDKEEKKDYLVKEETEAFEVIREEQPTDPVSMPESSETENEESVTFEEILDIATEEEIEEIEPDFEKPITQSLPKKTRTTDRKVEVLDAPPAEEITNIRPVMIEETPPIKEDKTPIVKKKRPVGKINLMIPAKKKQVDESTEETVSTKTAILDREPVAHKDPVLIGDKSSPLSGEVQELPRLAELLETNQAIPQTGFVINGLIYPQGSYLLSSEGTRSLAAIIDLMNRYPTLKIEIGSHTSAIGDDVVNHNLSRKRAMSIMAFLAYKGISNDRMTAKGYGETQLLNACANGVDCTDTDHEENDRIEVKVVQ